MSNRTIQLKMLYGYIILLTYYIFTISYHGLLLSQLDPVLFIPRLDFSQHMFHTFCFEGIVNSQYLKKILDILFILSPIISYFLFKLNSKPILFVSYILLSIFLFVYGILIDATTPIHYEGFIMFGLFSILFISKSFRFFYFIFNCYRYLFLLFFLSAGLWKLRTGAIFHIEQMSAILYHQHIYLLSLNSKGIYSSFILFLINHPYISYSLFFIGTFIEISFLVGFFTKKYDRILFWLFITFVISDYILMQIDYLVWIGYALGLWYSEKVSFNGDVSCS